MDRHKVRICLSLPALILIIGMLNINIINFIIIIIIIIIEMMIIIIIIIINIIVVIIIIIVIFIIIYTQQHVLRLDRWMYNFLGTYDRPTNQSTD